MTDDMFLLDYNVGGINKLNIEAATTEKTFKTVRFIYNYIDGLH